MAIKFDQALVLFGIVIALLTINIMWEQHVIGALESEINVLKEESNKIEKSLIILSFRVDPSSDPLIFGNPQKNESIMRKINITSPSNNSTVVDTFQIEGYANLSNLDRIYIISKIENKYWILMDGQYDQLNNWKGAKNCLIPPEDMRNCKFYEIFAIITQDRYNLGTASEKIPDYLARSDTIYINQCFNEYDVK